MNWGAYIKRTAVRRVVWVMVGLLVYAVLSLFGVARAQSQPCSDYSYATATRQEAHSCAHQVMAYILEPAHITYECRVGFGGDGTAWPWYRVYCNSGPNGAERTRGVFEYRAGSDCPAGAVWREDLGRCFDPSECGERNTQSGFNVPTTTNYQSECFDGCVLALDSNQGWTRTQTPGGTVYAGSLTWTGDQCALEPGEPPQEYEPPERPDSATCTAASSGQSFCIKPDGQQCYTASSGREVCWRPTETGEKSDRDVLQKRNAGQTEIPPSNLNLPTGDTLEKVGESVTTETTRTQGNTSSTTTTTTTNYQTQFGTNPGTGDEGSPSDGSGGEGGEGDSDTGSVDGGGDCEAPPIVRGGDPVVAAVVDQTWATRCAVEAGNAAKVTGDVADCASPFSVEGDNANAVKLRAMREQICQGKAIENAQAADGALDAELGDWQSEYGTNIFAGGQGHEGAIGDGQGIVTTRYGGGGSCPQISVDLPGIGTWEPPAAFCSLIAALRLLFIAVATVWALRTIGS